MLFFEIQQSDGGDNLIRTSLKKDDYIIISRLKKFCKENGIENCSCRADFVAKVEEFSDVSEANQEKVNIWLDTVSKEGIKYSYIRKIYRSDDMFKSELYWKDFIKSELKDKKMCRVNEATYSNELNIQFIEYEMSEGIVHKIKLNLGLFVYEVKKASEGYPILDKIIYPIFAEININKNILEIRLKSKSNIRKINNEIGLFEEKVGDRITTENMAEEVMRFLKKKLTFNEDSLDISKDSLFKSYYKLLESLTNTPTDIVNKIQSKFKDIKDFSNKMFEELNLNSNEYIDIAEEDLNIWLEKFISLSEPNKEIFIKDKDGYPVKLIATDSEDTRIEEISAKREPLQTKSSYFDHKKILQKEQLCDGMSLAFNRIDNMYYGKDPFLVILYYKKGFGVVKFQEYVEEGDIQNVLSRIIENF